MNIESLKIYFNSVMFPAMVVMKRKNADKPNSFLIGAQIAIYAIHLALGI